MAKADLNGDTELDLVTANGLDGFRSDVSVLLGDGSGEFQDPAYFDTDDSPVSVAVADLDGDTVPDIVTANGSSNNVSVLLGNGDGTFQEPASFEAGDDAVFVALADLDGDDHPDIVTANVLGDDVSVLLGNGDGTFQGPAEFAAGDGPVSVAVAKFDDDDFPDLVTANRDSDNVSVLLGNGDGTFQTPAFFTAGDAPVSVAVADLDEDDLLDLATANRDSNNVSVLLGNGDGTFQAAAFYPTGIAPVSIAIDVLFDEFQVEVPGPFFPETFPDLVTANRDSNDVSVLLSNGDGSFRPAYHFEMGNAPISVAIHDIFGDTRNMLDPDNPEGPRIPVPIPDLVTANRDSYNVTVRRGKFPLRNSPANRFLPPIASMAVADEVRVLKVKQFCTAVDKNGEGITDPTAYLTCYDIRKPLSTQPQVVTTDQFGELELDVRKPRSQICLPTDLRFIGDIPVPPESRPALDNYEFYNVRKTRGSDKFEKREVSVEDIFLDETVLLKKPRRLGAPTDLSGSDVRNPFHNLNCYSLKPPKFKRVNIQVENAFGALDLTLRRPNLLCTPSEKELVSEDP
ncbi:MAG: VCBS repeat-containing protein [Deltaproteobacteria bacterium]|nr:VCBS repeat-containing protein [Deltaproteobacteria bacterium]